MAEGYQYIVVIASVIKLSYMQMKLSSPAAAATTTSHQRDPYIILYFIDYNFLVFLYVAHNQSSLVKLMSVTVQLCELMSSFIMVL